MQIQHMVSSQVTIVERSSAEHGLNQSIDEEGVMHLFENSHSTDNNMPNLNTIES